jgi:hypothetical protein
MSVVEEIAASHGIPLPDMKSIHELRTLLDLQTTDANNLRNLKNDLERKIDNVAGYLRDCLDMGDSPDADSIADYLDIELKREFAVRQEVTFDFVVTALNEDEAQQIAEGIWYSATGDFDSDDYEVTDTQVEST